MTRILDIIEGECLPRRDCMLTVQDTTGEAGFLYFKEGELIEANCANRWGQDALARISEWQLAEHFVAPLPLGIKRSLWGSLSSLFSGETQLPTVELEEHPAAPALEALAEVAASLNVPDEAAGDILHALQEISGLQQVGLMKSGQYRVLHQAPGEGNAHATLHHNLGEWLPDFIKRGHSLGEMIGFGRVQGLGVSSERTQVVGVQQKAGLLLVSRLDDAGLDDLEESCRKLLGLDFPS
jgi:hypothetical protein